MQPTPPKTPVTPPGVVRRVRPLPVIAAAVIVVALLGGLLVHFGTGRISVANTTPTATPTATEGPRPGDSGVHGNWQKIALSPTYAAAITSPSDPNIVYSDGVKLQRSDDGGKSWRTLAMPKIAITGEPYSSNAGASLLVSTDDPDTLVAHVYVQIAAPLKNCPKDALPPELLAASAPLHGGILASGAQYCQQAFVSHDGGASWQPIHVPDGYSSYELTGNYLFPNYLSAQGGRLFGSIEEPDSGGSYLPGLRILTSTDGVNWQFADTALRPQVKFICEYLPDSMNSVLYAVTLSMGCNDAGQGTYQIWRSDDAGAHWSPVSTIPALQVHLLGISRDPATGRQALYIYMSDSVAKSALYVRVSTDGGQTWWQAPTAGTPAGQKQVLQVFGTLSDGSVVAVYTDASTTFNQTGLARLTLYAWRVGDASWRRITPTLSATVDYSTRVVTASGNHIWLVTSGTDATHTVILIVYTFTVS